MLSVLAAVAALGLTINAEPGQVLVLAVLLGGRTPDRDALAFAAGWLVSLGAVFAFAGSIAHLLPTSGDLARTRLVAIIELSSAAALVSVAWLEWRRRDRPRRAEAPGWLAHLDGVRPWQACLLGAWEQPWTVTVAAGVIVLRAQAGPATAVIAFVVFACTSTLSLAITYAYFRRDPSRSATRMRALEQRITTAGPRVFAILAAVAAALLAADALHTLTTH